jgi:4-amino-4-deoxy-L-arabinose transferase-like glycosyltransferase
MPPADGPAHLHNRLQSFRPAAVVSAPPPRPARRTGGLILVLIALGIGLRLVPLLTGRDLWIDEAMLALNLVNRSPAELLGPLDWNQGAPVGFLLLSKSAVTAFGTGESALRLVSFVGSVLGLLGFAWLAGRLLPRPAAILAVGLCVVSPALVSYAAECKQYATDAAVAVGLFAAAAGLLLGERGGWRWVLIAFAGAAAVWVSHPAAFVLGGVGTALMAEAAVRRDRKRLVVACLTVGVWLVSFAGCYAVSLRHLGANSYLLDYWAGHFLPLPPTGVGDAAWLVDHAFTLFQTPGGFGVAAGLAAVLFVVGIHEIVKERWPVALALVLPAAFALAASAVHKYPFAGRLLLFLIPLLVLGVARGAWAVTAALRPALPLAAVLVPGVLLFAPTWETLQELRRPSRHEQLRTVLDTVRGEWQPGDRVYVYYGAVPAFTYYTREHPFPVGSVVIGTDSRADRGGYRDQLAGVKSGNRVWLVFSHRHKDEETLIRTYADGLGRCGRTVTAPGAAAYRIDTTDTTNNR